MVDGLTRSDERATRSSGSSARSGRRRARILAARIGGQGVRRTGVLAGRGVPPRRSRFCAPARSAHNRPEHGLRPLSPPLVGEVSAVGWRSQLAVFDVDRRVAESFAALVVGRPDLSRTGADRGRALERVDTSTSDPTVRRTENWPWKSNSVRPRLLASHAAERARRCASGLRPGSWLQGQSRTSYAFLAGKPESPRPSPNMATRDLTERQRT